LAAGVKNKKAACRQAAAKAQKGNKHAAYCLLIYMGVNESDSV
jgi:hypothetical protein